MRNQNTSRRQFLAMCVAMGALDQGLASGRGIDRVEVWKDPSCGCCKDWVAHLESNGFKVHVNESGNAAKRAELDLPERYGSCHTALVSGYVIEGHVPASDVRLLLKEKPKALGLAVPGMPVGSPGMDGPAYGGRREPYQVLLVEKNGNARVYKTYA